MDAVKFLEEVKRMCDSYEECEACQANADGFNDCLVDNMHNIDAADAVSIVEKWLVEHPRKTRQSVFLEQYPETYLSTGTVNICPNSLYEGKCDCARYQNCLSCKREFWSQEVE